MSASCDAGGRTESGALRVLGKRYQPSHIPRPRDVLQREVLLSRETGTSTIPSLLSEGLETKQHALERGCPLLDGRLPEEK